MTFFFVSTYKGIRPNVNANKSVAARIINIDNGVIVINVILGIIALNERLIIGVVIIIHNMLIENANNDTSNNSKDTIL